MLAYLLKITAASSEQTIERYLAEACRDSQWSSLRSTECNTLCCLASSNCSTIPSNHPASAKNPVHTTHVLQKFSSALFHAHVCHIWQQALPVTTFRTLQYEAASLLIFAAAARRCKTPGPDARAGVDSRYMTTHLSLVWTTRP